jgi:hypothetical protein
MSTNTRRMKCASVRTPMTWSSTWRAAEKRGVAKRRRVTVPSTPDIRRVSTIRCRAPWISRR